MLCPFHVYYTSFDSALSITLHFNLVSNLLYPLHLCYTHFASAMPISYFAIPISPLLYPFHFFCTHIASAVPILLLLYLFHPRYAHVTPTLPMSLPLCPVHFIIFVCPPVRPVWKLWTDTMTRIATNMIHYINMHHPGFKVLQLPSCILYELLISIQFTPPLLLENSEC